MKWITLFWIEIPIMLITVIYWYIIPYEYLYNVLEVKNVGSAEKFLLELYASVTLSLTLYYLLLLILKNENSKSFIALQLALCLGDLLIAVFTLIKLTENYNIMMVIQLALSTFWGCVRAKFVINKWHYCITKVN